jgi:hypothetical protein
MSDDYKSNMLLRLYYLYGINNILLKIFLLKKNHELTRLQLIKKINYEKTVSSFSERLKADFIVSSVLSVEPKRAPADEQSQIFGERLKVKNVVKLITRQWLGYNISPFRM